jgi:putative ABC transport system ATP-binding protein
MSVVVADGLSKTFGRGPLAVTAVDRAHLAVDAGELVLLLGPSGSGKTTLLSMIGGLLRPSAGTVRLGGRPLPTATAELARLRLGSIGFVFQTFNLLPTLTASDNVALPLRLMGVSARAARSRANELLEALGLRHRLASRPVTLSGGEKQRVSLARALVAGPRLVLADEPTASLDARSGREAMEVLTSSIRQRDRACLVVTHDTRLVEFADRVLSIEDGRLQDGLDGDPGVPER